MLVKDILGLLIPYMATAFGERWVYNLDPPRFTCATDPIVRSSRWVLPNYCL